MQFSNIPRKSSRKRKSLCSGENNHKKWAQLMKRSTIDVVGNPLMKSTDKSFRTLFGTGNGCRSLSGDASVILIYLACTTVGGIALLSLFFVSCYRIFRASTSRDN